MFGAAAHDGASDYDLRVVCAGLSAHCGVQMLKSAKALIREEVKSAITRVGLSVVPFERAGRSAFAGFCLRHHEGSFSQWQQDLFALQTSGEKRGGFFVEFGAADGLTHSNTYMLETKYGWSGLLIEPLASEQRHAKQLRPRGPRGDPPRGAHKNDDPTARHPDGGWPDQLHPGLQGSGPACLGALTRPANQG